MILVALYFVYADARLGPWLGDENISVHAGQGIERGWVLQDDLKVC